MSSLKPIGASARDDKLRTAARRRILPYGSAVVVLLAMGRGTAGVWEYGMYTAMGLAGVLLSVSLYRMRRQPPARPHVEEENARLAAIIESSADAIVGRTLDDIITSWNPAAERLYGYTAQEALGRSLSMLVPPERADELPYLMERIQCGEVVERYETVRLRKDGTAVSLALSISPIRNADGDVVGGSLIASDITAQKQAQEALVRHQVDIEKLNVRLQRAMAETHHRVKNNLQTLVSMLEMQMMEHEESVSIAALHRLKLQISTMAAIHDLLTKQAKEEGDAQSISLRSLLSRLISMLQQTAGARVLRAEFADCCLETKQATSLALVVTELVGNALKHGAGEIGVIFQVQGTQGTLEVCDGGAGFSPEFDPTAAANTGLELVESLVRWDLGGQTHYANRLEGGACVTVTLPLKK